jgi:hypothetical protein
MGNCVCAAPEAEDVLPPAKYAMQSRTKINPPSPTVQLSEVRLPCYGSVTQEEQPKEEQPEEEEPEKGREEEEEQEKKEEESLCAPRTPRLTAIHPPLFREAELEPLPLRPQRFIGCSEPSLNAVIRKIATQAPSLRLRTRAALNRHRIT